MNVVKELNVGKKSVRKKGGSSRQTVFCNNFP